MISIRTGIALLCGSCSDEIPEDSIFCPECGARQELSRAGNIPGMSNPTLSGGESVPGRNFGVVSGQAVQQQNQPDGQGQGLPPGVLSQITGNIQQQAIPAIDPSMLGQIPTTLQGNDLQGPNIGGSQGDLPQIQDSGTLLSGAIPKQLPGQVMPLRNQQQVTTNIATNPVNSPTDAMVNHLAVAEREMKSERRNQWLEMNQESAVSVLSNLGQDLPDHLKGTQQGSPAAEFLAEKIGDGTKAEIDQNLLRRMAEVAVRRVARKRGVAVETPQVKLDDSVAEINVTYVDDGRVLDTPENLSQAFEHAITTEVALKGLEVEIMLSLFRSKDGELEQMSGSANSNDDSVEEDMFACEVCDGLVRESDSECPHCGALFEDDEEPEPEPSRSPQPGRSGPPGPNSRGGPPGPGSRGGPPGGASKGGPPGGPSKGGPPGGPSKGGPPGGPSKGGPPGGPSKGGPPGGPSKGGPPGGGRSGPPGGPSKGGPGGPSKGGPGGPSKGGPRGGPSKGGPPGGPKRGPPR